LCPAVGRENVLANVRGKGERMPHAEEVLWVPSRKPERERSDFAWLERWRSSERKIVY